MIGTPPSARKIPAVPADPAEHAVRFAHTWADRLEHHVEGRMHALDIPEHQIGASDLEHGVPWRVFFPHEHTGDGNVPGGRITVDSGVPNPELNAEKYGPQYASLKSARCQTLFLVSKTARKNQEQSLTPSLKTPCLKGRRRMH